MTGLPVIITRAEPGAGQTARRVAALGLVPLVSPALSLQADPQVALPDPATVAGLVFTSANGVRFYTERDAGRDLTAWCVGPSTAQAARDAGFSDVRESAGNARDLAAFIAATATPTHAPLLHVANAAASGALKGDLEARGIPVAFAPLYRADTAPALSPDVARTLSGGTAAVLLIHSAKGAQAFAELSHGYRHDALTCVAISTAATRPLRALDLAAHHVAPHPNEAALMDTLQATAATLSA